MGGDFAANVRPERMKRVALAEHQVLGAGQGGKDAFDGFAGGVHEPGPDAGRERVGFERGIDATPELGFVAQGQAAFRIAKQRPSDGDICLVCWGDGELDDLSV